MNAKQRSALDMIRRADGCAQAASCASMEIVGGAWIHWRTAEALERRGLIEIDRYDEWAIRLLPAGEVDRGA